MKDSIKCHSTGDGFFRELPPKATKAFNAIKCASTYRAGRVLFIEREAARGVYLLCEGEVKLSVSSREGKTLILRVARPGDILGLVPVLSGTAHELTAETLSLCQLAFVTRDGFLRFLSEHPEAYAAVAGQLSSQYKLICDQLRNLALAASAPERLAKLLLDFAITGQRTHNGTHISLPLTHETIAEFIGTTRETVTRILGEFKSQRLLQLRGSNLTIENRRALKELANV